MAALAITLPFQMLPVAEGATQPENIEVSDISCLCVRFAGVGETGIGKPVGTSGATRYELSGSAITVHVAPVETKGEAAILIDGNYGQVKLHAKIVLNVGAGTETITTVSPYVFRAIAAGGDDYKTDVYMDGDGRVMVERGDDGSTTIYDEHENPIMKRLADGTTEIFDAYQSPKIQLAANGACKIMSQGGGTAAIETKSNGDLILKTYNGNEIFLDNNGGVTINNKNGESVLYANDEVTSMSTPDGYRCISAYKDDGLIITYHDKDRIALNENEFVLFDSNGDLQIASNEESFNIMQNGRNVITISNNNTHINNQNSNEIFTANDNGITIYDQDGGTSVTFNAALIAKLNAL